MKNLNYNELSSIEGGTDVWDVVDAIGEFTIGVAEGITNGLFGWGYWE